MTIIFTKKGNNNIPLLVNDTKNEYIGAQDLMLMPRKKAESIINRYPEMKITELFVLFQGAEFKVWPRPTSPSAV